MATTSPTTAPLLLKHDRTQVKPLTEAERERAASLGERFREEFTRLLTSLPRSGASALSLSRDLGLDRNLCHRLCSALEQNNDSLYMLTKLPGPQSLHAFIVAAREKGGANCAPLCKAAAAATERFDLLIRELGGSQARFNTRLRVTTNTVARSREHGTMDSVAPDSRVRLFDIARETMSYWAEMVYSIRAFVPFANESGQMLRSVSIGGYAGLQSAGAPFTLTPTYNRGEPTKQDPRSSSLTSVSKLPGYVAEFSTEIPQPVKVRELDSRIVYVIDINGGAENRTDLSFLKESITDYPTAKNGKPPAILIQQIAKTPIRWLMMDLFIHKSFQPTASASLAAMHALFGMSHDEPVPWHDRLPGDLKVELLGSGLDAVPTSAWGRYIDVARHMFSKGGLNPDEFIGYRCQVAYPYWGACYVMHVELGINGHRSIV